MKRMLVIVVGVLVGLLLAGGAATSFGSRGHAKKASGHVTIESWLQVTPSATGLSGTVKACFKLDRAFKDEGGDPTWSDATYATMPPHHADLTSKCGDWAPVGGAVFVPPTSGSLYTLYAVHTITGRRGQIFITFAGTYDLPVALTGSGTWVITGGTGEYTGATGQGTWTADAAALFDAGYIRHTEQGVMSK